MPGLQQVSSLTQFFSVFFLWKLIDLPGGQINDPSSGKHYSLPFLPATPSSPSRTLEGLFELTRRPSRALDSPRALLPELQRYKDTVNNNWHKPWLCVCRKRTYLHWSSIAKSQQNKIELVTRPEYNQNLSRDGSKYGSNVSLAHGTSPANDVKVSKCSSQTSYERVDDEAPRIPGHDLMRASPENVSSPPCSVRSSSRSSLSRSSSLVSSECVQVRPPCTTRYFQKCRDNIRWAPYFYTDPW